MNLRRFDSSLSSCHTSPRSLVKPNALLLVALSFGAGCTRNRPQVMTPVRLDTVTTGANRSPPEGVASIGRAGRRSVSLDDPFARLDRLDWPAPTRFRSAGSPGPDYWQQRADYLIAVTLDTLARTITGTVTIRYTNNSPDTLCSLWLQLDQNLYRAESKGSALFPAESRWGVRGFQGGFHISNLQVNGSATTLHVDDTMGRIDLDAGFRHAAAPRRL